MEKLRFRQVDLDFDLLGKMIEAAKEINVKTSVYLSAGLDERLAKNRKIDYNTGGFYEREITSY